MGLDDYAQALGAAQRLVPNLRDIRTQELQQRVLAQEPAAIQAQTQLDLANVQKSQFEQQQRGVFQTKLAALGSKPTPQAYRALATEFPQFHEALDGAAKGLDADKKAALVKNLAPVQNYIKEKQYDKAAALVKRHIDADVAAGGQPDETDQELYDELVSGDPIRQAGAGGLVFGLLGQLNPEQMLGNINKRDENAGGQFTLNAGSKRFDATGKLIASADFAPVKPNYQYDSTNERWILEPGTGGGDPVSSGPAAGGRGDVSRLINSDAGGGYVPESVKTVGQFVSFGKALNKRGAKSSSAGTYQINGTTMAEFAPQALGANWKDAPYDAAAQEKVGEAIFNWAKLQDNPAAALRGRWVSLNPQQAARLVQGSWSQARGAIAQGETGGGAGASAAPSGGGLPGVVNVPSGNKSSEDLSGDALDGAAEVYMRTGQMPVGLGRQGMTQRAILNRAAEIRKAGGTTVEQQLANWQDYKTHQQGLNAFARGPESRTVRSLNVTIDHLDTLQNAAQALQNGNIPIFNKVRQAWARATGSQVPTNFEGVRQIVSAEVAKAVTGGPTALADRQDLIHGIETSNSPQQLAGYIAEVKKLMAGQLEGLAGQYKSATGRDDFGTRLSPRTRKALGYDRPQGGAPVRVNSVQQAMRLAPGTVYVAPDGKVRRR